MTTHKKVLFLPRAEVEQLIPPPRAHLISISDGESDQAKIDRTRWASVSFHHFVDGGYDEGIVTACDADFPKIYASYFLPETANAMRQRIFNIADGADMIVVNCIYGRSRSAAVARYINEFHGFKLDRPALEANMTVYRLLAQDPGLIMACRQALAAAQQKGNEGEDMSLSGRISRWLGLGS
jgi:hypothetical protein